MNVLLINLKDLLIKLTYTFLDFFVATVAILLGVIFTLSVFGIILRIVNRRNR